MKALSTIIGICLFTNIFGQALTIEKYRLLNDTVYNTYKGHLDVFYRSKKQINDLIEVGTDINSAYFSKKHSYQVLSEFEISKTSNTKLVSDGFIHQRTTLNRKQQFSHEGFIQLQYDLGLGLENRYLVGLSERFRLVRKKDFVFMISLALMAEQELWKYSEVSILNQLIKTSINNTITLKIAEDFFLFNSIYYQARINQLNKPRFIVDNHLKYKINKHISFKLSGALTYDYAPVIEVARFYYDSKFSISYEI